MKFNACSRNNKEDIDSRLHIAKKKKYKHIRFAAQQLTNQKGVNGIRHVDHCLHLYHFCEIIQSNPIQIMDSEHMHVQKKSATKSSFVGFRNNYTNTNCLAESSIHPSTSTNLAYGNEIDLANAQSNCASESKCAIWTNSQS